jgi:hypothetical protein
MNSKPQITLRDDIEKRNIMLQLPTAPSRTRNHIGFTPKKIVAKHVIGGYVSPAQSVVQQLINGLYNPPQQTRPTILRSFEGTVFGRVVVKE